MKKLTIAIFCAAIISGCARNDKYPDTPTLEFKSLTFGSDGGINTVTLTATFTDGDGDIGYYQDRPNDSIFDSTYSAYYYDFVIALQVYRNNNWKDTAIIMDVDTTTHDTTFYNESASSRLPYLTQSGQNKGLKGDIDKTSYLPGLSLPGDTIRFSAFIYDRALHKSNIIYTPGYFIHNP